MGGVRGGRGLDCLHVERLESCDGLERGSGLVEGDVAIRPYPTDEEVDPSAPVVLGRLRDALLVVGALLLEISPRLVIAWQQDESRR